MINISTLIEDMKHTLKWDDRSLYSKHYTLPDSGGADPPTKVINRKDGVTHNNSKGE